MTINPNETSSKITGLSQPITTPSRQYGQLAAPTPAPHPPAGNNPRHYPTSALTANNHNPYISTPPLASVSTSIPMSTSIPLSISASASPIMPFLPNLSLSSNSMNMNGINSMNGMNMSMSMSMSPMGGPPSAGPSPPHLSTSLLLHNQREKAAQNAISNERARIKELEQDEHMKESNNDLSISDLKLLLKKERSRSALLVGEVVRMKSMAVASQAEAEVCEEGRINGLMRRLDWLQKEKGRIIVELEREEEMLTNTLQKKLNEVRREKAELEKQIEREHTFNLELKAKLDAKLILTSTSTSTSASTMKSLNHKNNNNAATALSESIDSMPSLKNDNDVSLMLMQEE